MKMRYLTKFLAFLKADTFQKVSEAVEVDDDHSLIYVDEDAFKLTKKQIIENENLIRILSIPEDEWPYLAEIFNDFDVLSSRLEQSELSTRDKFKIIIRMYEKNIGSHILETTQTYLSETQMLQYKFEHFPAKYIISQMHTPRFLAMQIVPREILTEEDRLLLSDIESFREDCQEDVTGIYAQNKNIYDHYILKKDTFDAEDIPIIITSFQNSGVSAKLCEEFSAYLTYTAQKRQSKTVQPVLTSSPKKVAQTPIQEPTLSKKDHYKLMKELNTYFDFDNMQAIRVLIEEEIARCLDILHTLKESSTKIEQFIIKENRFKKQNIANNFALYLEIYHKLKFYESKLNISAELEELEMYFQEMFLSSSDDYAEWKENFEATLNNVYRQIQPLTEYEEGLSLKLQ